MSPEERTFLRQATTAQHPHPLSHHENMPWWPLVVIMMVVGALSVICDPPRGR